MEHDEEFLRMVKEMMLIFDWRAKTKSGDEIFEIAVEYGRHSAVKAVAKIQWLAAEQKREQERAEEDAKNNRSDSAAGNGGMYPDPRMRAADIPVQFVSPVLFLDTVPDAVREKYGQ